ncbi:DUF4886 domain-containing protein [Sphingomonas qomolangmaensis]|uniref:PEP-CTERM sorting domain-containing protein n=1 Tax=Sphingomonas qomolangmaensis TaxID=2918765 RepID=A0ABY5LAA8_9SPHN|nr:PEP-CTERM sorting domain-containing protein [Sphingomonas qomolangmaensis]UUL83362.1 PEP-CTERM sorting domain-containing protein [Sphingomonas qomolangmaensis]
MKSLLALAIVLATPAQAETILFVGNSFTYGAESPVHRYRPDSVTDLNREGVGGVPALFAAFAEQAGFDYDVHLETGGGRSLAWHLAERREAIDRRWDHVVLQEYSTLDATRPGDATRYIAASRALTALFRQRNPRVAVRLNATWSRPDLTYRPGSRWSGKAIASMANDVRAAADRAQAATPEITDVAPVGQAFTCAIRAGIADADPYNGIDAGKVGLWAADRYHGSMYGYYLEALVLFGQITRHDPRSLGRDERAARDLGIAPEQAGALQAIAAETLKSDGGCGA